MVASESLLPARSSWTPTRRGATTTWDCCISNREISTRRSAPWGRCCACGRIWPRSTTSWPICCGKKGTPSRRSWHSAARLPAILNWPRPTTTWATYCKTPDNSIARLKRSSKPCGCNRRWRRRTTTWAMRCARRARGTGRGQLPPGRATRARLRPGLQQSGHHARRLGRPRRRDARLRRGGAQRPAVGRSSLQPGHGLAEEREPGSRAGELPARSSWIPGTRPAISTWARSANG